jgi:hypothetical protein
MWRCFLMAETGSCQRRLRRYESRHCAARADGGDYCEANARIEDGPVVWHRDDAGVLSHYTSDVIDWPRDDPRWPTACDHCGQPFGDRAVWQLSIERSYTTPEGGEHTIRDMPIGAIWRADWLERFWAGPDGRCYAVQLPPGGLGDQWVIEQPSQSGGGWVRTGVAPDLTAAPSILTPRYHGYLTGGVLTDDLDGRRY